MGGSVDTFGCLFLHMQSKEQRRRAQVVFWVAGWLGGWVAGWVGGRKGGSSQRLAASQA
jgi:hypothetical protein